VQELEESIGQPLFERLGRRLLLTSAGETALDYANDIFALSDELAQVLRGGQKAKSITFRIAVTDSVPKLLTVMALQPVVERHRRELELECSEGDYADLLGRLAVGQLDAVLTDAPVPANLARVLEARVLSESGMTYLAARPLARRLAKQFPASLQGAPFLSGSAPSSLLGQAIQAWFARQGVRPHVVGRIDDSALLQGFAQRGLGIATVPTSVASQVIRQSGVGLVTYGRGSADRVSDSGAGPPPPPTRQRARGVAQGAVHELSTMSLRWLACTSVTHIHPVGAGLHCVRAVAVFDVRDATCRSASSDFAVNYDSNCICFS
jgi:LysR family transcriptional regulator, transcriptional activator of nhaA